MTFTIDVSRELARSLVGKIEPRWSHVHSVGVSAEALCEAGVIREYVVAAAWLHDIGYGPAISVSGFHPLDGARFLAAQGAPKEVTRLVAWHTGAGFEAAQRGLLEELDLFAQPDPTELDTLTMIDLATGPDGSAVLDVDRIAEILSRYTEGHPVHEAVTQSRPSLLASSRRAKERLGLPQDWPLCG